MAKIKYVYIAEGKYNKTSFARKWKELLDRPIGFYFRGDEHDFIAECASHNPSWKKIMAKKPEFRFKIIKKKFQASPVKGVALCVGEREIWIGKQKLIEFLFHSEPLDIDHRKKVIMALRQLVEPQIKQYRAAVHRKINRGKMYCALTGASLDFGEFHIDHSIPFKILVEEWCREVGRDLERIDVACRGTSCKLKSKELAQSFSDYHLINARLQATTKTANLKKGSKVL